METWTSNLHVQKPRTTTTMELELELPPKRARSGPMSLPAIGEDTTEWLEDRGLALRHGTSMRLMADVTQYLNDSTDFNEVDPNADWEKWTTRRSEMSLYFAAITDVTEASSVQGTKCVLRAVLDGIPHAQAPHRPRLIIDYVHTRPEARGAGLASLLIDFVKAAARSFGANTYVLATEDACVYWLGAGFVLESGANIKARLLVFPDCHLLRRVGDPDDPGSADDLELALEEEEDDDDEGAEGEAGEAGAGAAEAGGAGGSGGVDGEDPELQAALAASLANSAHRGAPPQGPSGVEVPVEVAAAVRGEFGGLEERELQAAIKASLAMPSPPAAAATSADGATPAALRGSSQADAIDIDGAGAEEEEDEKELQAAIALSLQQ